MQNWEYLQLNFTLDKGAVVKQIWEWGEFPKSVNKNTTLPQLLNWYGSQGWELVAVEGGCYYFKRPTT